MAETTYRTSFSVTTARLTTAKGASSTVTPTGSLQPVSYRERQHSQTLEARPVAPRSTLEAARDLQRPPLTNDPETQPVLPDPTKRIAS